MAGLMKQARYPARECVRGVACRQGGGMNTTASGSSYAAATVSTAAFRRHSAVLGLRQETREKENLFPEGSLPIRTEFVFTPRIGQWAWKIDSLTKWLVFRLRRPKGNPTKEPAYSFYNFGRSPMRTN